MSKRIEIDGTAYVFSGAEDDPYFQSLKDVAKTDGFLHWSRLFLDEASVFIDIGANIGLTTAIASQRIAPDDGNIYAFEPSPSTFANLKTNIERNEIAASAFNVAVGASAGQAHFLTTQNTAGAHIITDAHIVSHSDAGTNVAVIALDDFVREQELNRIDLIKIDVEGFECGVLAGMAGIVQSAQFDPLVFIELNAWCLIAHANQSPRVLIDMLRAKFAHVYLIKDKRLTPLDDENAIYAALHYNLVEASCVSDLIACNRPVEEYMKVSNSRRLDKPRKRGLFSRWLS